MVDIRIHPGLIVLLLILLYITSLAEGSVKIVPIGDSITQGTLQNDDRLDHPTYRYWLWNRLQEGGYDVDFVGSSDQPHLPYDFDQDHEGHDGYRTRDFLAGDRLKHWLSGYSPDIALVQLGTNDAMDGVPLETTINNLDQVIDILRERNPDIVILMGTVIPRGGNNENLPALNRAIGGLADRKSTGASPVVAVDQFSGYDGYDDNQPIRYLHPNRQGEQKIADRYYAALVPYLSGDRKDAGTTRPTDAPTNKIATPTETVPTPRETITPKSTDTQQTQAQTTPTQVSLMQVPVTREPAPVVIAPQTEPAPASPVSRGGISWSSSKQYLIGDRSFQSPVQTGWQAGWTPAFQSSVIRTWTGANPGQQSPLPPAGFFIRWYPGWGLPARGS